MDPNRPVRLPNFTGADRLVAESWVLAGLMQDGQWMAQNADIHAGMFTGARKRVYRAVRDIRNAKPDDPELSLGDITGVSGEWLARIAQGTPEGIEAVDAWRYCNNLRGLLRPSTRQYDRHLACIREPAVIEGIEEKMIRLAADRNMTLADWQAELQGTLDKIDRPGGQVALHFERADTLSEMEAEWVWPDVIPIGAVSIIAGEAGEGKSTVTMDVISRAVRGCQMPTGGGLGEPIEALLVNLEDRAGNTIRKRLAAAGCTDKAMGSVHVLSSVVEYRSESWFALDRHAKLLDQYVGRNPGIRLVVVDPISAYMGEVDENSNREVRSKIMAPLQALAERRQIAVVVVQHLRKGRGGNAQGRLLASQGFAAGARVVSMVAPREIEGDEENKGGRWLIVVKSNWGRRSQGVELEVFPSGGALVRWGGEHGRASFHPVDQDEIIAGHVEKQHGASYGEPRKTKCEAAFEFVTEYLRAAGGTSPKARVVKAAEIAGHNANTLMRAVKGSEMVISDGAQAGAVWTLSE